MNILLILPQEEHTREGRGDYAFITERRMIAFLIIKGE
jgi:predicted type IV restriction endonuclease